MNNRNWELELQTPKGECEKQGKVWQLDKESFQDKKKNKDGRN